MKENESKTLRLIVDPPATGAWNMAVDEALLEQAAHEGCVTLRFYEWAEPTLSLGYFQSHEDRKLHPPSADCPLVRRQSGGGAILHDRELTYSLIVPPGHELTRDALKLYSTLHDTIIDTIVDKIKISSSKLSSNWMPQLWAVRPNESGSNELNQPEPFLCFQRRAAGDVVLAHPDGSHHKIVGSAQRRRRGAILQHGSILLDRSPAAPELPGMNDILQGWPRQNDAARSNLSTQSLIDKLCETLITQLGLGELSPACPIESATVCKNSAEQLLDSKHSRQAWLHRR